MVATLIVASGVITVVPKAKHGISPDDTYVLTPTVSNGSITWTASGGGVKRGYAKK